MQDEGPVDMRPAAARAPAHRRRPSRRAPHTAPAVGARPVRLAVLRGLLLGGGARLHVERDAYLEELQGRQNSGLLGAAYAVQHVYGVLEPQAGIGGHSHRVPEVELVVALVVVGDAGVGVYCLGAFVELVRWDLGRHQARLVAEDASVEDRADLAYNPSSFERLYPADDLAARDPHLAPDRRERLPLQRKLPLDEVENVLV